MMPKTVILSPISVHIVLLISIPVESRLYLCQDNQNEQLYTRRTAEATKATAILVNDDHVWDTEPFGIS